MGRPRLIDYDETRRLYATGEYTQKQLAEMFGVSTDPIRRALHPQHREYQRRKQEDYKVPCANGCGNLVHGRQAPGRLCKKCWADTIRVTVQETTLRCVVCKLWDSDDAFPHNRSKPQRRGRHTICRKCQAEVRQRSRVNRMVPCVNCGKPRTHPKDNGGRTSTGLCLDCYRESR